MGSYCQSHEHTQTHARRLTNILVIFVHLFFIFTFTFVMLSICLPFSHSQQLESMLLLLIFLKSKTHSVFEPIVLVFAPAALLSVIFSLNKRLFSVKEVIKTTTCYLPALSVRQAKSANSGQIQWNIHQWKRHLVPSGGGED